MKNLILIIFVLFMMGKAVAAGNTLETTPIPIIPPAAQNVSPEALFDQIRGFLTIPVRIHSISVPTLETPNFDTGGIQNLNDQIRDITGLDILQFISFLWHIFLIALRYLWDLLPRTAG